MTETETIQGRSDLFVERQLLVTKRIRIDGVN